MTFERRNVVFGLVWIGAGLLVGAAMGAAHDLEWVGRLLKSPPARWNNIMYAHAHFGVIGLTNVALAFFLPMEIARGRRVAASWAAIASGVLVPAGILCGDPKMPEGLHWLKYLQAVGFVALAFAVAVALAGVWRARKA